jgi:hypothetical protein
MSAGRLPSVATSTILRDPTTKFDVSLGTSVEDVHGEAGLLLDLEALQSALIRGARIHHHLCAIEPRCPPTAAEEPPASASEYFGVGTSRILKGGSTWIVWMAHGNACA